MDKDGVMYVPTSCQNNDRCILHIHFHGCGNGMEVLGKEYYSNVGLNEVAEANDMIILYPQAAISDDNPLGCFDGWGFTSQDNSDHEMDYVTKAGTQIAGVWAMVEKMDEGNDRDHCNTWRIRMIPLYIVLGIVVASLLGSFCSMLARPCNKVDTTVGITHITQHDATDRNKVVAFGEHSETQDKIDRSVSNEPISKEASPFVCAHFALRVLEAGGKRGVEWIASLASILCLQLLVCGAVLYFARLDENEFEVLQLVPPAIAIVISAAMSVLLVTAKDRLWVSIPLLVICSALIGVLMIFSCDSVWVVTFSVTAAVELSFVESLIAVIRLNCGGD